MPSSILLCDAYERLPELTPGRFDLVLTDPPYSISRPNNFQTMGRQGFNWEWDRDFDVTGWIALAEPLMASGGSMIVFTDWKLLGAVSAAGALSGLLVKDPILLRKTNPMPRNTSRRYVSDKEFAVWMVKPGAKWFFDKGEGAYARSTYSHPIPSKRRHPTKKPTELFVSLIERHCPPGGWILDPFAGEGTTAVAAALTGRNSVSLEKDPEVHSWALEALVGAV